MGGISPTGTTLGAKASNMEFGLKGKTALILCAGGGLGRAIALAMAQCGATVAVTDIDECALAMTVTQIEGLGCRAVSGVFDLMDTEALGSFAVRAGQQLGGIDILVNISGGPPPTTAADVHPHEWINHFRAMVVSMIYATDMVLPGMRAKKWGRVITSTSSGVLAPIPNLGISNTLRSALVGWSKTLASEVGADGITVNVVVPGRIATGRIRRLDEARAARDGKTVEEIAKLSTASIPIRRYGTPEEFANVVAFLASEKASYITGTMIRVDGGMITST
jgi:3-oxoacyl-[acyl-carrier protein] reductase